MNNLNLAKLFIVPILLFSSCGNNNKENAEAVPAMKSVFNVNDTTNKYLTFEELENPALIMDTSIVPEEAAFTHHETNAMFDSIRIDNQLYYVVEGDLLLDSDEVEIYKQHRNKPNQSNKLLILLYKGEAVKIENPTNIRYAVIKSSFDGETEYNTAVASIQKAASDWSAVCNVKFNHIVEYDDKLNPSDNPADLTFVVKRLAYGSGGLLASAFFPYYPKAKRKLFLSPSFFTTTTYDKAGILRHELGHIMGFLHEHIRSGAPAVCPSEAHKESFDLTPYDPNSVMHYFCGNAGTRDLTLTKTDSIGASIVYPY